ncbi:hypothetical protein ABEG63_00365 [Chryseobacterium sp. C39-AII1]|uniref:hypothetical protein n=1 Tax=Chryseobacterium sp. C39-AII1 TaxID=3080332 RepID=UPI0032085E6B
MKKITLFSFVILSLISCSNDSNSLIEEKESLSSKDASTQKVSVTKSVVEAESKIQQLQKNQSLNVDFQGNRLRLTMQDDCNLVLYYEKPASNFTLTLWKTNTNRLLTSSDIALASAQTDGNFVVYQKAPYVLSNSVWATNSYVGSVSNPYIKLQLVRVKNELFGTQKYVYKLLIEGNGTDRVVVAEGDLAPNM